MEKLSEAAIPGLATIAADIRAIEGGIDMIENISPSIQHALTIVQILSNGVNMTPEETAKLRQDRIDENNKTGG
jgi:hypothetical protein